jgi:hypothetical protein
VPDLNLSVTYWSVNETDSIQLLNYQTVVTYSSLFPGRVERSQGQGGTPGAIVAVDADFINFGRIDVAGIDYEATHRIRSRFGDLLSSLTLTQTYHYKAALVPGATATNGVSVAQDTGNWAPRWKGVARLDWITGPLTAEVVGRYVGPYQDYASTREIGNVWLCDANLRFNFGQTTFDDKSLLHGTYVAIGGVNIFDRAPQFSNAGSGYVGYDFREADVRGRMLYLQLGVTL